MWSSWLNAAKYYCDYLIYIREIVNSIEDDGILVKNAKLAVNDTSVYLHLYEIKRNYINLTEVPDGFEKSKYTIETGYEVLTTLTFQSDPVNIKEYLISHLEENGISKLISHTDGVIRSHFYYCGEKLFNVKQTIGQG